MKAISTGDNIYDIFDDSLQVYDQLPSQTYAVKFSEKRGFFLVKYHDMEINEPKVYGVHDSKIQKVMSSFGASRRNLGVILSGDKGIGKSLFAKMLAKQAVNNGMPVIVIDTYYPGIASYIESIEQNVMILFDEFDKTFGEVKSKEGHASPQAQLLSVFDGLSVGKKLFVVTCNEMRSLNDYLINRPGRFHYHFRFEYPTAGEIREYLKDKLPESAHKEIDSVVSFAGKVRLNYDCLRAIAFELQFGLTFAEAIKDLNIVNTETEYYNVILKYKNGLTATKKDVALDMFGNGDDEYTLYMYDSKGCNFVDITFSTYDAVFDTRRCAHVIMPENIKFTYFDKDDEESKAACAAARASEPECLIITRKRSRNIHYTV